MAPWQSENIPAPAVYARMHHGATAEPEAVGAAGPFSAKGI